MAVTTAAVIGAAAAGYGAYNSKQAAKDAAKGSQVQPWGPTGPYMESLLDDAMAQWNAGAFDFGPDPNIYNAFLDQRGKQLGIDTSSFERIDPNAGYGPAAYEWMLNLIQGPAWQGATKTNPGAMVGVQDPWVAGLMGGIGTYGALGGGGGAYPAITGSGPATSVQYPTQQVTVNPSDIIYGAVP